MKYHKKNNSPLPTLFSLLLATALIFGGCSGGSEQGANGGDQNSDVSVAFVTSQHGC